MASFDSERGCSVVRVVYDGPGLAGKTTNLRRVCDFVPTRKRSELYTPAELKGRTMFFDWLEVDAPPKLARSLKFQLITVPGQIQRNYRRRPLVEMADVIVFVCDATAEQIPDTMRTFARLRASIKKRESPVPLVIQVNKQDVEGALAPEKMRRRLRIDKAVPLVAAQAVHGVGVRETLATAMQLGIRTLSGTELEPVASAFQNADALFDHVLSFEDRPHEGPVDAEELYIGADDSEVSPELAAAHLAASSLDALEARARRAAARSAKPKAKQRGAG
jgi:signal recognition particle receptor subunit beta